MKIKNVNLSLLILSGLMLLSFAFFVVASEDNSKGNIFLDSDQDDLTDDEEKIYGTDPHNRDTDGDGWSDGAEVQSGYDPLKPAPGDRLEVLGTQDYAKINQLTEESAEDNLTNRTAQKIVDLTNSAEMTNEGITMENIEETINSVLEGESVEDEIPLVSRDEIKIKEQNYENLGKEAALEKEKEDFADYMIAIYYIMASNSPRPITSATDMTNIMKDMAMGVLSAVSARDTASLEEASVSGEKILTQIKEVEVPETAVELHLKMLSLSQYASQIKEKMEPKTEDPLGDILNLSKIQNFINLIADFSEELEAKIVEYDIDYDDEMKEKIEGFGLVAPEPEDLEPLKELIEGEEERETE